MTFYPALAEANRRARELVLKAVSPRAKRLGPQESDSWTLEQGLAIARTVEAYAETTGWHCALAGSVMREGRSDKDVDLVLYPRDARVVNLRALRRVLREVLGWDLLRSARWIRARWRKKGVGDTKHVEAWRTNGGQGKRVDLIIPSIVYRESADQKFEKRWRQHYAKNVRKNPRPRTGARQ